MKIILKSTAEKIMMMSAFFLSLILILFYNLCKNNQPKEFVCGNKNNIMICGTENLSADAQQGKQLFNSNCAACHKLDAESTGPALRNTDSIVYLDWMYYEKHKINKAKLHQLKKDYHRNFTKNNFKVSDLNSIYNYISER